MCRIAFCSFTLFVNLMRNNILNYHSKNANLISKSSSYIRVLNFNATFGQLVLFFLLISAALLIGSNNARRGILFFLPIAGCIGWIATWNLPNKNYLLRIFLLGFALRVLVGILLYIYSVQMGELGFMGDDGYFDMRSWTVLTERWHHSGFFWEEGPTYHAKIYYYFMAVIFYIFGHDIMYVVLANCILGALIGIYAYRIAFNIYGQRVAKIAFLLTMFLPNGVTWFATGLRDASLTFLTVFATWHVVKLRQRLSIVSIAFVTVACVALYLNRMPLAILLLWGIIIYLIIISLKIRTVLEIRTALVGCLIVFLIGLYSLQQGSEGFLGINSFVSRGTYLMDFYQEAHADEALYTSTSIQGMLYRSASLQKRLVFLPASIVIALLSPIPPLPFPIPADYFSSPLSILKLPGTIPWYVVMPFILYGFIYSIRNKANKSFMLYFIPITTILSIALLSASAFASRYRLPAEPFLLIFAAIGIAARRQDIRPYIRYFYVGFFLLICGYFVMKLRTLI